MERQAGSGFIETALRSECAFGRQLVEGEKKWPDLAMARSATRMNRADLSAIAGRARFS